MNEPYLFEGESGQITKRHLVYRCVSCQRDTYVLFQERTMLYTSRGGHPEIRTIAPAKVLHKFPITIPVMHPSVPNTVREASIEAAKCLAVGAYNACGVMSRRAMHALCDDKRAEGKNLYERLKSLKDSHVITPDIWEWAEELRVVGRSGAHTEWEEVTPEDADYAVRFLLDIIKYVYINPSERAARKLKETKKKTSQDDTKDT